MWNTYSISQPFFQIFARQFIFVIQNLREINFANLRMEAKWKCIPRLSPPLEQMGQKVIQKVGDYKSSSHFLSDRWRYDTQLLQKHMGLGIKLKLAEPYFLLWCHLVRRKTINFSSFRQSIFHKEICSGSM